MTRKRGRQREDHYFAFWEDGEDPAGWSPLFATCTPAKRLPACPVCAAKTLAGLERRYRVESDHWDQWVAIDTRQDALGLVADDMSGGERSEYRITPLWMVAAHVERMPEWEP